MLKRRRLSVAGVDGCKAGWYVTVVSAVFKDDSVEESSTLRLNDSFVAGSFSEVLSRTNECDLVCVDIPIGLCDAKARKSKEVAPDDILDALVAAWTAGQIVRGKTKTLPQIPELDKKGLKMEIIRPAR